MKKIMSALLVLVLSVGLVSCGKKELVYDPTSLILVEKELSNFSENVSFSDDFYDYDFAKKILICTMTMTNEDIADNAKFTETSNSLAKATTELFDKDWFDYSYICLKIVYGETNEIFNGSAYDIKAKKFDDDVFEQIKEKHIRINRPAEKEKSTIKDLGNDFGKRGYETNAEFRVMSEDEIENIAFVLFSFKETDDKKLQGIKKYKGSLFLKTEIEALYDKNNAYFSEFNIKLKDNKDHDKYIDSCRSILKCLLPNEDSNFINKLLEIITATYNDKLDSRIEINFKNGKIKLDAHPKKPSVIIEIKKD